MMRVKRYITIIIAFVILAFSIMLTSCGGFSSISKIEMKNKETIEITAGDFSYDGIKLVISYSNGETKEIDLTEDMIPDVEKLNFYKMGEHDVKVVYSRYQTTMKINVSRHQFDDIYELVGYTTKFDGKPHKVELNYELPEGATIEYPYGNTFTNAGTYDVTGVISKSGYVSKTLTARLVIEKADYEDGIIFNDLECVYDGEAKSIVATEIPEGVEVTYDIYNIDKTVRLNSATNAGKYVFVAKFSSGNENYNQIESKEAILTINKAKYDMSKVYLDDYTKTYDGLAYEPKLASSSVLPSGVNVSYKYYKEDGTEVLSMVDAGEYKIVASFTGNTTNYELIDDISAKLTVNKRIININDRLTFESKTVNFNREVHSLEVVGNIPDTVTLTYENNDQVYAGEYKVIAHFEAKSSNEEVDTESLEAYLIINQIREAVQVVDETSGENRQFTESDLIIEEDESGNKVVNIKGLNKEIYEIYKYTFTVIETGSAILIDDFGAGEYRFDINIIFKNQDLNNSVILSPATGTYQNYIDFDSDISLVASTVSYDGNSHKLELNKALPEGTKIEYPNGQEFVDAGTYDILCVLSKEFYNTKEITAKLVIEKIAYDTSTFGIEDHKKTYDGLEYALVLTLPTSVIATIKYLDLSGNEVESNANVGKYIISISFSVDGNHLPIDDITKELEVEYLIIDNSQITFENKSFTYDGDAKSIAITGDLPEGVNVTYEGNERVNIGQYEVKATFSTINPNTKPKVEELTATITITE